MSFDPSVINQLIRRRRSVFPEHFTGQKVDDQIVAQMIENAVWAPSHRLTQPWRFIIFTGEGLKTLAREQAEVYKKVTTADGSFREDKYKGQLTKPLLSSHIIVILMQRDEKRSVPEVEEIGAVFCAIENMYLTATAYGIGCYLSTGGITYFEEAKGLFGIGKEDRVIGFMHVGTPKPEIPDSKRKPTSEVVQWVRD